MGSAGGSAARWGPLVVHVVHKDGPDAITRARTSPPDERGGCALTRPPGPVQKHAKAIAAALLALLCLRFAWALEHGLLGARAMPSMAAALALGGCLWWVAQRQVGGEAAALVLALYVSTPAVLSAPATTIPALGLFAMLYTGVGVAHALAGPRHKWPGRIGLMAAICAFTGWAQLRACAAGLALSLAAMLWLMERGRRWLVPLFTLWIAAALAGFFFSRALSSAAASPAAIPIQASDLLQYAGLILVSVGALWIWSLHRRSRYFGHSAPLLAALLLFGFTPAAGGTGLLGALPFALLFIAGALDDGFSSTRAGLWRTLGWSAVAVQVAESLLLG